MNAKRLHIHSLPLVGLALALIGVSTLSMATSRQIDVASGLFRSPLKLEAAPGGLVKVTPSYQVIEAAPGAFNRVTEPPTPVGVSQAVSAASTLPLHMAIDEVLPTPSKPQVK